MRNKKIIKDLNLSSDEKIKLVVRRYLLIYWLQILVVAILLLLPFFLLYPLFQWEMWGPAFFIILLAVGFLALSRLYIIWYFNCLVITTQRIVDFDQRGMLDKIVSEVPLERVDDITYRCRGFFQSLLNYGTVQYSIPPGRARIIVKGVRNPQKVCKKIIALAEEARVKQRGGQRHSIDSVDRLKDLLEDVRIELGRDNFDKIIKEISGKHYQPRPHDRQKEIKEFMEKE